MRLGNKICVRSVLSMQMVECVWRASVKGKKGIYEIPRRAR